MSPAQRLCRLRLVVVPALFALACGDGARDEVGLIEAPVCVEYANPLFGIDVSKWQGTIDWADVKAAGVQYAFIRVSDGISTIDEKFPANWTGAAANGIPRGVYQFFRPNRDAIDQARIVIDHLDMYGMGELPPVIDVEATGDITPAAVAAQVGLWMDEIEGTLGVRPIIYSGSYFWDDNVKATTWSDYPFWIAHYTSASCPRLPAAWDHWTFWQYSSTGSVAGIAGNVDMNRFAGTHDELLALVPDETCRLDPGYRACADDTEEVCVDGRLVTTACGAGRSCQGETCVTDAPEPEPEVVEPGPELVEPTPEPEPEVVEPPPEVVEPDTFVPDTAPPEDTFVPADTRPPDDTAVPPTDTASPDTGGAGGPAHAVNVDRSVAAREVTPASGCAGGGDAGGASGAMAGSLAGLVLLLARARRRARLLGAYLPPADAVR